MDFGTVSPTSVKSDGPLVASVDGQVARLSAEEIVFHDPRSGENHVMTMDVLAAMDASRQFQPMGRHVEAITQRIPALKGKSHAVEKVFEFLRSRSLVVDADQMLDKLRSAPSQDLTEPAGMVIRTCDRPAELEKLAKSLAANEAVTGRGLRYLVVDDSRHSSDENHRVLAPLKDAGLEVHHLDRAWRQRMCKTLPNASVSQEILGLGETDSITCGGAWNTALLLTAGERFLMLDDDFVMDPRSPIGGGSRQLSVREGPHLPMQFPATNMEELAAALPAAAGDKAGAGFDPLHEHLAACGQSPAVLFNSAFAMEVSPQTLQGATFPQINSLLSGEAIKTTAAGAWGDWRMDTNLWLYLAPPAHTEGMRRSEASYRALSYQPVMAHGFVAPQLTQMSNFTPLAFDNRQLLPCTVATGRGEDFTFAAWLRFLYPESLCLHFPTLLKHQRPTSTRESPMPEAYVPWLSRFAAEYSVSRLGDCAAEAPAERLSMLVRIFRDLAEASVEKRQVIMSQFLTMIRSQIVEQAQIAMTGMNPAPNFWVTDAKEWITENGRKLTDAGAPRMRDWPASVTDEQCANLLSQGLREYADHLEHWEVLWQHSKGIRESLLQA
ncbi:MAG: hypothetical protein AB8B96_06985 [Lysobacterales bacterium]